MTNLLKKYQYLFLALISGASLPLAFAPFFLWPIAILSPAILLFLLDRQLSPKENQANANTDKHSNNEGSYSANNNSNNKSSSNIIAIKYGALYWLGFYLSGVSWVYVSIHVYSYTPAPIAAFLALLFASGLALVCTTQLWLYTKFNIHRYYIVTFPASWVLVEWFRTWFLTGFPWLFNGYALIDSPLSVYAPIGGVYFLSFISIFAASLIFFIIKSLTRKSVKNSNSHSKKSILLASSSFLSLFIIALFLNNHEWVTVNKNKTLRFHLIQANISQHDKWLAENQNKILSIYSKLIQQSFDSITGSKLLNREKNSSTDHIIVLPEAAMPAVQSNLKQLFHNLGNKALELNTTLISGIFYDGEINQNNYFSDTIYNSVIAIGNGSGLYHKQQLVPFGEYVPFENLIRGLVPFFDLPFSSFARGAYGQSGLSASDSEIAPFICYEILYPALVRDHGKASDILLTISNDAWFGNSTGPEQHFQMARMRALELGKYLVRTTNTGTTAVIDHRGKVTNILEKNIRDTLTADAYRTEGTTPYAKWGTLPTILGSLLILLSGVTFNILGKKTRS